HPTLDTIAPDQPFIDLGIDSLMALELRDTLAQTTGLTLPATLVFNHPNSAALADSITAEDTGAGSGIAAQLSNELDRLETFLLHPGVDDQARGLLANLLADRLRTILSKYHKARSSSPPDEPDLQTAPADQLLFLRH